MEILSNYNIIETDKIFDEIYSKKYQNISSVHWTPIHVIKMAVEWLSGDANSKVLDIGSGVGKFCLVGSIISKCNFIGVENRKNLHNQAVKAAKQLDLKTASFINDNIINIDFSDYDAFYYFNPFFEQIANYDRIDSKTEYSVEKYSEYEQHVYAQLLKMPTGTKVVTYHSFDFTLPKSYELQNMMFEGSLLLWVKN